MDSAGLVERLIRKLRVMAEDHCAEAAAALEAAQARIAELEALTDRLKLEAQGHASEARTANATIAEIYQVVSGGTGERGNWHGAEPVRTCITALRAQLAGVREALVSEREDNLWEAYNSGHVKDGQWTHMFLSTGEWLARECGFDPREAYYPDEAIRTAIPTAAIRALATPQEGESDA